MTGCQFESGTEKRHGLHRRGEVGHIKRVGGQVSGFMWKQVWWKRVFYATTMSSGSSALILVGSVTNNLSGTHESDKQVQIL